MVPPESRAFAFSDDGRRLATVTYLGEPGTNKFYAALRVWDFGDRLGAVAEFGVLRVHGDDFLAAAAFLPAALVPFVRHESLKHHQEKRTKLALPAVSGL